MRRSTPPHCPWPSRFSLDNYKAALQYAPILKYFMNSVIIVGISVLVTVALVAMCAYVISRFEFKLKTLIVLLISASLMLPAQAISQPLFAIFQKLGIFDTKLGLIIVYSAMGIPMSFFVMVSYYKTISTALEESAYIDGATFIQTFLHIILPLAKPGLVTIAMIQFINIWNEFYFALDAYKRRPCKNCSDCAELLYGNLCKQLFRAVCSSCDDGASYNYFIYPSAETGYGESYCRSCERMRIWISTRNQFIR